MHSPKLIGYMAYGFSDQDVPFSVSVDEFDLSDKSDFRVFWQIEPPEILPTTEPMLIANHKFYNLILTWSERVLAACPNAEKFLLGTCRWATNPADDVDVSKKTFSVSFLTSSKQYAPGHIFRHEIFSKLPPALGSQGLTITKHMSPPEIDKQGTLYPFQFSIIVENCQHKDWITEKMIDCLVSRTIPIYWGAPNVGEHFNKDGILSFNNYAELIKVLESLTPETYKSRLSIVEENWHTAMKYTNHFRRVDEAIRRRLSERKPKETSNHSSPEQVRRHLPRIQRECR